MAFNYTLEVQQGATLALIFGWYNPLPNVTPPQPDLTSPVDLTGWTARAQVRGHYSDTNPYLDLTTANGGVVLGGVAGTIQLVASASTTAALNFTSGVWDLEL